MVVEAGNTTIGHIRVSGNTARAVITGLAGCDESAPATWQLAILRTIRTAFHAEKNWQRLSAERRRALVASAVPGQAILVGGVIPGAAPGGGPGGGPGPGPGVMQDAQNLTETTRRDLASPEP